MLVDSKVNIWKFETNFDSPQLTNGYVGISHGGKLKNVARFVVAPNYETDEACSAPGIKLLCATFTDWCQLLFLGVMFCKFQI